MEPLAVKQYAEATGNTVYETGLWTHPTDQRIGASPDGLVFDPRASWRSAELYQGRAGLETLERALTRSRSVA